MSSSSAALGLLSGSLCRLRAARGGERTRGSAVAPRARTHQARMKRTNSALYSRSTRSHGGRVRAMASKYSGSAAE